MKKNEIKTKSYFFMQYAEWFFIDKDWNLKLTRLGLSVPECVESYEKYLKDIKRG